MSAGEGLSLSSRLRAMFHRFLPRPGLQARLVGFFILSLTVPTALSVWLATFTVRGTFVHALRREQKEVAVRIADRLSAQVVSVQNGLSTLLGRGDFARASDAWRLEALRTAMRNYPSLVECEVVDAEGHGRWRVARLGDGLTWGPTASRRSSRPEFQAALEGRASVGSVFYNSESKPRVFLSFPLRPSTDVLLARLSLESMRDLVVSAAAERAAAAYVLDEGGTLLAHPDYARVLSHENWADRPLVRASSIREEGASIDLASDPRLEEKVLGVWRRIPALGWRVMVEIPERAFRAPLRTLASRVAWVAVSVSIGFLLLGLTLVRRILLPLRDLKEGVARIGAGDVEARLNVHTGDELEELATAVNELAASLGQAERMRQDLTHMIVHDLKSPLSSILGSMEYVLSLAKGNLTPDQTKMLSLGNKAGKDLLRMIQNLLDLGKMEQGRLELHPDHFSILELAGQCVDDLEALILRENKFISIDMAANLPKVWGDRDLIHRVLANLLSNALKHTPRGTEISVHVAMSEPGNAHVLCVRDTGEGVPPEFLTKIFEKFSQAESKKQNVRVGSGLGLAFCKLAVEAHGGRIWVESQPGRGSAFFFTLPLAPPLPPPSA